MEGLFISLGFPFHYLQITGDQLSEMYKDFTTNYPGKQNKLSKIKQNLNTTNKYLKLT